MSKRGTRQRHPWHDLLLLSLQSLGFADDIDIIGRTTAKVCEAYTWLKCESARIEIENQCNEYEVSAQLGSSDDDTLGVLLSLRPIVHYGKLCILWASPSAAIQEDFETARKARHIAHWFVRWSSMDASLGPSGRRMQTRRACLSDVSFGSSVAVCSSMELHAGKGWMYRK